MRRLLRSLGTKLNILVCFKINIYRKWLYLYKIFNRTDARIEEITATVSEGVYITDSKGLITFCNLKAAQLLGYSPNALLGRDAHTLFHCERPLSKRFLHPECKITKTLKIKNSYQSEQEVFLHQNGDKLFVNISATPVIRKRKVIGNIVAFQDISIYKSKEEKLKQLAFYDPLTNLPNRRLFNQQFKRVLTTAKYGNGNLAVLLLDLDNFKAINDNFGHNTGDEVLKTIAQRLHNCVRGADIVSRQGGDEFVLILAEMSHATDAAVVCQHILKAVETPFFVKRHFLYITASIGISVYNNTYKNTLNDLIKRADVAMYGAKKAGGNQFCFFENEYNRTASPRSNENYMQNITHVDT